MGNNDFQEKYFTVLMAGAILLLIIMAALFVVASFLGTDMGDSWMLLVLIGALCAIMFVIFYFRYNKK